MKYPLRMIPWWTDGANRFVANFTKWYPRLLNRRITAFEVGSGNSTLFLLSRGFQVTSAECDQGYIRHVSRVALSSGFSVNIVKSMADISKEYDLTIISLPPYSDKIKPGFWFDSLKLDVTDLNYDVLINDGVDRAHFLRLFDLCKGSIIILDNCEYAANWGKLTKSSAKPDLSALYRKFLRSSSWKNFVFEQTEGRDGMGVADPTGWESNHRWLTSVSYSHEHIFSELIISDIGMPLVNNFGINDHDLSTLTVRCPFNWDEMKWEVNELYPETLDLKLKRSSS